MSEYSTLVQVLAIYDDPNKKRFYPHDVTGDINQLPESERKKTECFN